MADPTPDAPATSAPIQSNTPPITTSTSANRPPDGDEPLGEGGKKALQAERQRAKDLERQLKELEPVIQKAREREDAEKSETTKLNEALAGEREARTKAERDLLRYTVGVAKGVPANLIGHLTGSTNEEVEQSADALLAALGEARPQIPSRPTERVPNARATDGKPVRSTLDDEDPIALIRMGRGQSPK